MAPVGHEGKPDRVSNSSPLYYIMCLWWATAPLPSRNTSSNKKKLAVVELEGETNGVWPIVSFLQVFYYLYDLAHIGGEKVQHSLFAPTIDNLIWFSTINHTQSHPPNSIILILLMHNKQYVNVNNTHTGNHPNLTTCQPLHTNIHRHNGSSGKMGIPVRPL